MKGLEIEDTDGNQVAAPTSRIGHRYRMRWMALLALVLANAGFSGDLAPRVAAGKQPRDVRTVERADAPAGWTAIRDRDTQAIAAMWGGSIVVSGSIANAAIAERAARDFATRLLPAGTAIDQFVTIANRVDGGKRTVVLQQTMDGLRVVGAQLFVVFAHDRLFAAGSTAVPAAKLAHPSGRAAVAKTTAWLARSGIAASVQRTGERVVLPLIYARGDVAMKVVDLLDARAGVERWDVYVEADGTPVLRASRVAHGSGRVRFDVPVRHPLSTRTVIAAARANMIVDNLPVTSNDTGFVTWNGNLPASVIPSVTGPLVNVINDAGAAATDSLVLGNGVVVDWSRANVGNDDAQLTAFTYGMLAKSKARAIHPTLGWLDQQLAIHVNKPGSCNALSTGDDLHFFGAGACENAARVTDVVLHEFGHSFHVQSYLAGSGVDLSLGEGLADFFAANFTDDPGIGRGLNFDDVPVRNIDPPDQELVFPDDVSGDPHVTGLIVAGALWDLREAMIDELGALAGIAATERVYLGVVQHGVDVATSYLGALIGDDDDGDLGNGTPHLCKIEAAFAAHGLVADFATTKISPPVVDGRDVSVAVEVPVGQACERPALTGIDLTWQIGNGPRETIAMVANGATYTATLPAQNGPTVIRYRIDAYFDDGTDRSFPDNPADPQYQLFLGTAVPLWCDSLDADPQWKQTGAVSWDWAKPIGRAGDAPAAFTGEAVLGTNILGSGRFRAAETTAITTPEIDITGFADVHLQFYRWLTIEDRAFDRAAIHIAGETVWENATGNHLDHVDREWRFVDLPMKSSGAITWSIDSNGATELGGWNIDDVCVVTFDADACVAPECMEPEDTGGCCSSSGGSGSLVLGVGVLGLLVRRRRRHS